MTTKVLNLYAGIGGSRKLWGEVEDVDVTAVEWNSDRAEVYRDYFPNDRVIEADAHEYLLNNFRDYDFIWASPPCPSHSTVRFIESGEDGKNDPIYPDMDLYQEILLLDNYFNGDYVVENVDPFYDPLIDGQKVHRHMFWSNFHINDIELERDEIRQCDNQKENFRERTGFDLREYDFDDTRKDQTRNNTMNPELGKHVFASRGKQTTLF